MKVYIVCLLTVCGLQMVYAQENTTSTGDATTLPYDEIPDYPTEYTAETVAARMIDGLGFRYYWATEGLREEDLAFKPGEEARTCGETIDHILGLTNMIINAVRQVSNSGGASPETFVEKRRKTLMNLQEASDILKSGQGKLAEFPIVSQRGDQRMELPFWNLINGPIADALWHVGQVVTFRRSSGNPFNSKANVMLGKVRQ